MRNKRVALRGVYQQQRRNRCPRTIQGNHARLLKRYAPARRSGPQLQRSFWVKKQRARLDHRLGQEKFSDLAVHPFRFFMHDPMRGCGVTTHRKARDELLQPHQIRGEQRWVSLSP